MAKTLTLFPDTNLFLQCRALQEIDWGSLGEFDTIDLVVTRPVQAEIDKHKGKGSGRTSTRARAASSLIGRALDDADNSLVIRTGRPEVRLLLRIGGRPSERLAQQLDYAEPDDQLVGFVAEYRDVHLGEDARVLTHDIGPRASAKAVGVPCQPIPDSWLLASETDEAERRLKSVQADLERYKAAEPCISLELEGDAKDSETLTGDYVVYQALTADEIEALTRTLQSRRPEQTDFGSQEPKKVPGKASEGGAFDVALFSFEAAKHFTPASDDEIDRYKTAYAAWLESSRKLLRDLHLRLQLCQSPPRLLMLLSNVGSRPAESALVTFSANGSFLLQPPPKDDERLYQKPALGQPPAPPKGRWASAFDFLSGVGGLGQLAPSHLDLPHLGQLRNLRDDEEFYYRPSRPSLPVREFSLECALWRHQIDAHLFEINLHVRPSQTAEVLNSTQF
ncbi:PIN domain-containing protein [Sphaerotilaceae bacterium SBD11-9]